MRMGSLLGLFAASMIGAIGHAFGGYSGPVNFTPPQVMGDFIGTAGSGRGADSYSAGCRAHKRWKRRRTSGRAS